MEAVKKYWFWGILISILSVFAMSYNANAITPVIDLNNYSIENYVYSTNLNCAFNNAYSSVSSGTYCQATISGDSVTSLTSIETVNTYSVKKDDLLHFYLFVFGDTSNFQFIPFLNVFTSNSRGWSVVDYKLISKEDFNEYLYSSNGYINWSPNNDFGIQFNSTEGFSRIYEITLRAINDNDSIKYGLFASSGLFTFNINDYAQRVRFYMRYFTLYRRSESQENKEVEEKTQEASDASETAGGSSSTDAQQGTTSLINAISGAVSVISSAAPTNCRINGDMGNLDIGQIDLCANPAPAFVQTIGSLILILMCVPLAITLFNRFISLFRSFQS